MLKTITPIISLALFSMITTSCNGKANQQGTTPVVRASDSTMVVPQQNALSAMLTANDIVTERKLKYDKHTLEDTYPYNDTTRSIAWEEIKQQLAFIENAQQSDVNWGVLCNYKNLRGEAPLVKDWKRNAYKRVSDMFHTERYQSVPLYSENATTTALRYGRDGWPIKILGEVGSYIHLELLEIEGQWLAPKKYVDSLGHSDSVKFEHVVIVDRNNQYGVTLERSEKGKWLARSVNPVTTGRFKPPYAQPTPLGIFVLQEKKTKMFYTKDGSSELAGYAPFASRFTNGAYLHGVPTQNPHADYKEWSWSLGTVPRSHMCVRNASSHAKFIFDNFPTKRTFVVIIGKEFDNE